eukprot:gene4168-5932_t
MWIGEVIDGNISEATLRYYLKGPVCMIGRAPENGLSFPHDKSISRNHAEIRIDPSNQAISIVDLGSKFGTIVNSTKLETNIPFVIDSNDTSFLLKLGAMGLIIRISRRKWSFCMTRLEKNDKDRLRKNVKRINGSIVTEASNATHIVANKIAATIKLLIGIVLKKKIIVGDWLSFCESNRTSEIIPREEDFPPIPSEDVRIVEPNVSRLQLFSGHVVFITTPADDQYSFLMKACGATVINLYDKGRDVCVELFEELIMNEIKKVENHLSIQFSVFHDESSQIPVNSALSEVCNFIPSLYWLTAGRLASSIISNIPLETSKDWSSSRTQSQVIQSQYTLQSQMKYPIIKNNQVSNAIPIIQNSKFKNNNSVKMDFFEEESDSISNQKSDLMRMTTLVNTQPPLIIPTLHVAINDVNIAEKVNIANGSSGNNKSKPEIISINNTPIAEAVPISSDAASAQRKKRVRETSSETSLFIDNDLESVKDGSTKATKRGKTKVDKTNLSTIVENNVFNEMIDDSIFNDYLHLVKPENNDSKLTKATPQIEKVSKKSLAEVIEINDEDSVSVTSKQRNRRKENNIITISSTPKSEINVTKKAINSKSQLASSIITVSDINTDNNNKTAMNTNSVTNKEANSKSKQKVVLISNDDDWISSKIVSAIPIENKYNNNRPGKERNDHMFDNFNENQIISIDLAADNDDVDPTEKEKVELSFVYLPPIIIEKQLMKMSIAELAHDRSINNKSKTTTNIQNNNINNNANLKNMKKFHKNFVRIANYCDLIQGKKMERVLPKESEREIQLRMEFERQKEQQLQDDQLFADRLTNSKKNARQK